MLSPDPAVVNLRESASWLAAHGCHVFPLIPGGKQPAIKNWEHAATTLPGKVRQFWASQAFNIGIATGPSGLVVIDLDLPKPDGTIPGEWDRRGIRDGCDIFAELSVLAGATFPPDTFTVATPSGGTHFYHRAPAGTPLRNTTSKLGWLIDTRAAGGYVVGPGSLIDGTHYRTINPTPPIDLPGWLADRLTPPPTPARTVVPDWPPLRPGPTALTDGRLLAYVYAALRAELGNVYAAIEGRRNHTLNAAAFAVGQLVAPGWLDLDTAAYLLTNAGTEIGLSATEAARTVASGLAAGARQPRTIGETA
jgi:hypothetical protein